MFRKHKHLLGFLLMALLLVSIQATAFAAKPAAPTPAPVAAPVAPPPAFVIPIEIRANAYDSIGTSLVQKTTDLFNTDNRFLVVSSTDMSRVVLHLSTQASKSVKEPVTAYGMSVTFQISGVSYRYYAGNTVGVCSFKEVPDDAKGIVDMTYSLIDNYADLMDKVKKARK